ncbi:vacuolar protein sorting-associated protein light isoform X4 [Rhipicephalus microplus]|uniref:vacuolar protein sorting-associated protein light isoform X4 n=1 Tax=Rhipicephalus microplus TaxID=6941 RepID=UPI003F6CD418
MDVIERSTRSWSRRNYDHAICPWMNRNILEVLKLKDFYYVKWKNNRSNEYYHQNFKLYRNKSVAMIRKSKKCYYTNLVKKNDGNTKKIWQIVKDVTGMGSKERITPDNPTREVADNFNDYFTNIGLSLARKFPTHMQNLNAPCTVTNNFDLCDVTEDDIRQVINKLPGNKAAGHDAISSRILKENIDVLCGPLCHIFNHAFSSKTYPSILKTAKVIPVYKSGDRNLPDSYRPISVLSSINTTLEKLISSQLRHFLGEQNVLCPQQHGFVANRSTSTAVSMLTQYINSALHENNIAIAVFLDIRKAFDAISHSILLEKMHSYGIKGNSLDFFSSYLSARKQKVVIGDIKSSYGYIKCGVPQGSVLGPILFSLYINDVPRSLQRSRALMYADDTVLVFTGHSLADLQNDAMTDLSNISEWFARNQLTVNCTKTKYMVFHSRRKHIDAESLNLTINNTPIQQVPCFKYLGVTFDEHLHWHEQVQSVCAKLAYGCYSLIKARQYFPQAILRTLYFSLCHCHIGYCLESWGVTYNSYLKTLERLQKRTLKIISQGESEMEPKLRYERILNDMPEILRNGAASCIAVHPKFIALGMHSGLVYILDHQGNNIRNKELQLHKDSVLQLSIDEQGDHLASCSRDGKVVIHGLYTSDHNQMLTFDRPVSAVAIDPNFYRSGSGRRFVTGVDKVVLYEKSFLSRYRTTILHQGEGPVRNISWKGRFSAWATDLTILVYDMQVLDFICMISRDHDPLLKPELYRCILTWRDERCLLVGWADRVKVCCIRHRDPSQSTLAEDKGQPKQDSSPRNSADIYVEIVSMFQTDYYVCGLAHLCSGSLVALTVLKNTDDNSAENSRPQLRVMEPHFGESVEHSSDILSVRGFRAYRASDYCLESLPEEGLFFVVSPKDVIVAKPRDQDDHMDWLLQHEKYEEAVQFALSSRDLKRYTLQAGTNSEANRCCYHCTRAGAGHCRGSCSRLARSATSASLPLRGGIHQQRAG